jgi:hypothetical protein
LAVLGQPFATRHPAVVDFTKAWIDGLLGLAFAQIDTGQITQAQATAGPEATNVSAAGGRGPASLWFVIGVVKVCFFCLTTAPRQMISWFITERSDSDHLLGRHTHGQKETRPEKIDQAATPVQSDPAM